MKWKDHIAFDPDICQGQACIKGTRIPVTVILDNLAEGRTVEQILRSYPTLTEETIRASLYYAAYLAKDRVIELAADEA